MLMEVGVGSLYSGTASRRPGFRAVDKLEVLGSRHAACIRCENF